MSDETNPTNDPVEEAFKELHKGLIAIFVLVLTIGLVTFFTLPKGATHQDELGKAQKYIDRGQGHLALPYLKRAVALDNSSLDLVLKTYQRCRIYGDKDEEKYLALIKAKDEKLGKLIAELAAYDDKGPRAFDKVIETAPKVLALRPSYAQAHALLGAHYLRDQKPEKAKAHIDKGLKDYPDSPALHTELAMLELVTNPSSDKVSEHFRRALLSHPTYRPALGGYLRYCTDTNRHEELITFLKERLQQHPQDVQAIVNLSLALRNSGKEQEGLLLLQEELAKTKGTDLLAHKRKRYLRPRLFQLLMTMEKWEEALALANEVIKEITVTPTDSKIAREQIKETLACLRYLKANAENCPRKHYSSLMTRSLKMDKAQRALKTFVLKNQQK